MTWLMRPSTVSNMSERVVTQWGKAKAVAGFRAFSLLGSEINVFALVLRERGHGAGFVGILMAAGTISLVAMLPLAGWISDRFSTQQIIPFTSAIQAILILSLIYQHNMVSLAITIFLSSSCGAIENPALMALMPTLVTPEDFTKQMGFSQSLYAIAGFAAPAFGGILVSQTGYKTPFLIDAITFLFLATSPFVLNVNRRSSTSEAGEKIRANDGLKYIFANSYLRSLAILITGFLFAAGTVSVAGLFLLTKVLHASVLIFGLVGAANAIGMFLGGVLLMKFHIPPERQTRAISLILFSCAILIILLSVSQHWVQVLILELIFGLLFSLLSTLVSTIFILSSPPEMRGRIGSALNAFFNLGMIGALLLSGVLVELLGTRRLLLCAGIEALALVAILSPATLKKAKVLPQ